MPLPAIGIGAATLAGSLITNFANAAAARSQMRFQERMAGSAHQRQVRDLTKAGINPLLGVGGVGAASPVGAKPEFEDSISKAVHSGLGAKMQQKQLELLQAQIQKEYSQAQLNNAHNTQITTLTTPQSNKLNAEISLLNVDIETKKKMLAFVGQIASSEVQRNLASAMASRSAAGHATAQAILLQLQEQQYRNMNEAQKSYWMKHFAPYLGSAKEVAGIAGNIAGGAIAGGIAGGVVKAAGRGAKAMARNQKVGGNGVIPGTRAPIRENYNAEEAWQKYMKSQRKR